MYATGKSGTIAYLSSFLMRLVFQTGYIKISKQLVSTQINFASTSSLAWLLETLENTRIVLGIIAGSLMLATVERRSLCNLVAT